MSYLAIGTVLLSRFEILEEIGRGGYSVVYRAHDRELDSDVAIKLLVPPPAMAVVARERMRREALAARRLAHANIVAVHDFAEDGPWSFTVMEYVAGPDLAVRLRDRGPLGVEDAARLGREIAAALSTGHRHGVLHRDVKPQNILLDPDGRARLTDFGSARLDGQTTVTATGAAVGTLDYMAPEVFRGQRGDARSDLYSLGLTLYSALTGRLPERASPHLPPSTLPEGFHPRLKRAEIPLWLDHAIAGMTAARPGDRYPSGAVAAEALNSEAPEAYRPLPSDAGQLDFCLLCGISDPLGLGLCPACASTASVGDSVHLVLHPPASTAERVDRRDRIQRLLTPSTDRETVHEVVEGRRVLARVPLAGAERVLERLSSRGIPVRAAHGKWAPLPDSLMLVACGMVLSGMAAGFVVSTLFFWLSPTMASLIVVDAQRRMRRPALLPPARRLTLSPAAGKTLAETLAQLPDGTARELLAELARGVHALMLRLIDEGAAQSGASEAEELLLHACAAARDLAAVEAHLSDLESQRGRLTGSLERWSENLSDTERTRDRLVQRLLDALAVLGRSRTRALEAAGLGHEGLDQVGSELELEVKAYVEGLREVAELVKSRDEVSAGP
jgi:serine/threonine protein kinase